MYHAWQVQKKHRPIIVQEVAKDCALKHVQEGAKVFVPEGVEVNVRGLVRGLVRVDVEAHVPADVEVVAWAVAIVFVRTIVKVFVKKIVPSSVGVRVV